MEVVTVIIMGSGCGGGGVFFRLCLVLMEGLGNDVTT